MPQSVHKLPFRLDDIPFFDTTMMCDPVMDRYYTPGTGNDSDNDSWDAPLKRSPTVATKITVATRLPGQQQHVNQLYAPTNDVPATRSAAFAGEFNNINEPFSRDPNAKFNPIGNRRGSHVVTALSAVRHMDAGRSSYNSQYTSNTPYQTSSSYDASPSSHELRARFEERSYGDCQRPASLKKRAAPRGPPPPLSSGYAYAGIPTSQTTGTSQRRNSFGKKMRAPTTPTKHTNGYGDNGNAAKMNPVREMELRSIRQRSAEVCMLENHISISALVTFYVLCF